MSDRVIVEDLRVEFVDRGRVTNRPLRGISLTIEPAEILGVVGETGCGKTLTGLAVLGLLPNGARATGRVVIGDVEHNFQVADTGPLRGNVVSMVFQNPGTAFNPVFTLGSQMLDVLKRHRNMTRRQARDHVIRYLGLVKLPDPERMFQSFPHELSGGMLQRAMIAMALLCEPRLLVLDEPTTALDATIAEKILELILELRETFGFSVLFITHNIGVVQAVCDRVAVLYAGRVVEAGPVDEVLGSPGHPYTRGLLGALPGNRNPAERLESIPGTVPSNLLRMTACSFADRCRYVIDECRVVDPALLPIAPGHDVACIRSAEL